MLSPQSNRNHWAGSSPNEVIPFGTGIGRRNVKTLSDKRAQNPACSVSVSITCPFICPLVFRLSSPRVQHGRVGLFASIESMMVDQSRVLSVRLPS